MSSKPGILIKQPVSVFSKRLNVNFGSGFTALTKAVVNGLTGNVSNVPENLVEMGAAVGLAKEPGEIAWLLIFRSLIQAMASLVDDNQDLLKKVDNDEIETIVKHRLENCLQNLEATELTIDSNFFAHPEELAIVPAIKEPFRQWLTEFVTTPAQAEAISNRLSTEFVYSLIEEWKKNSDKYTVLQTELNTPFIKASEREQAWQRYSIWLQKQVNERMFSEAFSLEQVYVPLRAYYERKIAGEDDDDFASGVRQNYKLDKKTERIIVDLQAELQTWLDEADQKDAIRVISGGPGSGKSSFSKIFAATQAKIGKISVLFIPLHLFDPEDDLVNGIGNFINDLRDIPLPPNPLDKDNKVEKLLIIFDGLDELAMQGKMGEEVAQKFLSEVQRQVTTFNHVQIRLQVLISGRELVIQKNQSDFRKPKQILHVLPYFVDEEERKQNNYIDAQNLLKQDQRQIWWCNYGKASGRGYDSLPAELDKGHLREITSQPLLNYLVALSLVRGAVKFSDDSNLNEIYADLLTAVYQRSWGHDNPIIKGVTEKDFVRILESIAVAAWHGGDVRVTTVSEIDKYCDRNILERILNIFKQDKKASLTRLLTAFYFRQRGLKGREETFEFTHKSFGEYLTARRIVQELKLINNQLKANKEDSDYGWNKLQALERWAKLCGSTAMDNDIFRFIIDEIRLQKDKYQVDVAEWQQTICDLIGYMLKNGMPMEKLQLTNFQEANRQARNAEEVLLAILNACARVIKKVSQIIWPYPDAFGNWIYRLRGHRVERYSNDVLSLNCLSFLNLQNCILSSQDFSGANLEGAILKGSNLERAILKGSNLQQVNLKGSNLQQVNLNGVNLEWANLEGANLQDAILQNVNLQEVNLNIVNLEGAILQNVNLEGAILESANLEGAILQNVNLEGAILESANLEGAILQNVNIESANVHGTILEGKI
ncbi:MULTISPECIES: pentapeptide repeat-containing protein [unclassified Tolypothrix]|uniref:pentapeptide repeat-containing protein n=1 Tax=unclassified Tolypothrix TaxID=2649714 RepID=UPI0005EABF4A|nr:MULTISPECIES: pentapeptide repeat-containing protein [unclassified Tolypothrix]BAY91572.1 pentapeptide repeat-containing protein [Microchaete diplosiphon NIES-3275]EKF05345.1 putative pentapeptide-repeat protein [Tolypothrix sp. PCC 7601]MBE9083415.1 pentapeptide repeat-containing protein [Tolypothrix sp. LEGE 11397]UYD25602.1 pentapeptide repeat-containing protein [Tolypothrix sp. PCC 7712]UYD32157.1 pentapeptide repeat-containing protein [Tolypothrix sp. PCC 7601]